MSKEVQIEEELVKSMDQLIDEFFAEEATASEQNSGAEDSKEGTPALNKASDAIHEIIGEPKQAKEEKDPNKNPATTADDAANSAPSSEEDEKAGKKRGRPEDLSQMANRDMSTGESKGSYDKSIIHASEKPVNPEQAQVSPPEQLKGKGSDKAANESENEVQNGASQASSDEPKLAEFKQVRLPEHLKKAETVEISKEEYDSLKKVQAETLRKAAQEETATLVKAEVERTVAPLKKENEDLKKELQKATDFFKSVVSKPQPRKSISSVAALEKGGYTHEQSREFSIDEKLDAAEALLKSQDLTIEDVIELENTKTLRDPAKRSMIERKLRS